MELQFNLGLNAISPMVISFVFRLNRSSESLQVFERTCVVWLT